MRKLRGINPSLPGMLLVNFIFLVIGELLIFFVTPIEYRALALVGFLVGVICSVLCEIHLSFCVRKIVYGGGRPAPTMILGYLLRFIVVAGIFAAIYFLNIGNLLAAIAGMFSMKVAAYAAPLADKYLPKS